MTTAELGQALALSDLAHDKGMTPDQLAGFPALLVPSGLPSPVPSTILRRAHKLYRDSIDGMMWRCCRPISESAPVYTQHQAQERVNAVETAKAEADRKNRDEATKREKKRAVANPTIKDIKAELARQDAVEAEPEIEVA